MLFRSLIDDGFKVTNYSEGGRSNLEAVDHLCHQLSLHDNTFDYVIWFQTDPLRDLTPYTNFNSRFSSYEELISTSKELLNSSYNRLNQLNKKIICIGGCSKLDSDIHKYKNLVPLIDSVIEFLLPTFTAPEVWHSDWIKVINSEIDENLLDRLIVNKRLQRSEEHTSELQSH